MSLEEQQTRAWKAKELLSNELLLEALEAIEKEVILAWESCPARDHDGKEQFWQLFKTSKKFRGLLNGYIETGKLATSELARKETFKDKLRKII